MDSPSPRANALTPRGDADDGATVVSQRRTASQQPNEKLALLVRDFSLVNRLLSVRIYQVFHTTFTGVGSVADCVGFRVAATDDVENDYALFISRAKGEQLYRADHASAETTESPSAEAIASSILAHLDIAGNRHRDVGRLVCRDPEVQVDHKPRAVPRPKSAAKTRNAHLPTKEQDKRASRNKQSKQRALDAIAASHSHHAHEAAHGDPSHSPDHHSSPLDPMLKADDEARKSRKISEASLLHRMAHATHAAVYRTDLGSIDDESAGAVEEEEEGGEADASHGVASRPTSSSDASSVSSSSSSKASKYKRALPDRKPKYSELQRRRDKERKQRLMVVPRPVGSPDTPVVASLDDHSPPKQASPLRKSSAAMPAPTRQRASVASGQVHPVAASAAIGNAYALKTIVGEISNEQEQFLRRRMVLENHNRVFKTESVFDDAMGVEITNERPDHRFHTPEHAPPSPDPSQHKRMITLDRRRNSVATQKIKSTVATGDAARRSLVGSASAPVLLSPRELPPLSTRADNTLSESAQSRETVVDIFVVPDETSDEAVDDKMDEAIDDKMDETNALEPLVPTLDLETDVAAQDDDAALESISITDEITVVAANEHPHDEPIAADVDDPALFPDETIELKPPRTARMPSVINIQEDDPQAHDETAPQHAENAPPDVVLSDTASLEAELMAPDPPVVPLVSPRVECWEEAESPQEGKLIQEPPSAEPSGIDIHESESTGPPEQQWASPPDAVISEEDKLEEASVELESELESDQVGDDDADAKLPAYEPDATPPVEENAEPSVADKPVEDAVEDPIVEVECPPQLTQPTNEELVEQETSTPAESPVIPPSLERTVSGGVPSRRGSILDAATAAIALAAAAAAVTAVTVPTVVAPQPSPKTSPKNESKRKHHKRRSHDATPAIAALGSDTTHADKKRLGPRRSTIHLLHTAEKARHQVVAPQAVAEPSIANAESPSNTCPPTPHHEELETAVHTPSSTVSATSQSDHKPLHPTPHHHNRQRSQHEIEALQKSPTYHTKWLKWSNGKQLIDKVSCLQLEEQLLQDPNDVSNLLKLGLRYARWPATSLPAVLLLENATVVQDGAAGHSHEYWNSLGNAHFDVFLRHRKFLPIAVFHLSKALQAFTRAFAYLEGVADPLLLLRYSICMYWKKSDGNAHLEHADDIFRELFTKFASFCDKDRPNLLFFHFQILCRLKMFNEAIECLHKIIVIHEATLASAPSPTTETQAVVQGNVPPPYDSSDYLLMRMHCQQASGDFLQASATFTQLLKRLHQLNHDILADGSTLSDHDYLQMWGGLADKCFHHEDYALAIEFYAITVTFAKDSRVLARVLYNHALCYQAIGEGIKCSAQFKRAKNINRHVVPFATLAEIHARYDDQYNTLLRTPVDKIIDDVRQNLYDRAVTSLQRIFRRKKKFEGDAASGGIDGAHTLQRSSSGGIHNNGRRQSVVATLTNLVEGSGNRRSSAIGPGAVEDAGVDGTVDPHEAFLVRHAIALQKLTDLREGRQMKKTSSMRVAPKKLGLGAQSGLLSPVDNRPDLRRKHSMDSLAKRLGYLPENREQFAGYWHNLVTMSLDLYETQTEFNRLVARIRSVLPLVSETVACCALADAMGNVDNALERLHDTSYEQELQLVSTVVDITAILRRHFVTLTEKSERTRFPPIKSPAKASPLASTKQEPSHSPKHASLSNLPPCKSPSTSNFKAVRLSSLIDAQFGEAGRGRIVNTEEDTGSQRLRDVDKFIVVEDFRAVNASLLHGWKR